jgi:hypothetical protein
MEVVGSHLAQRTVHLHEALFPVVHVPVNGAEQRGHVRGEQEAQKTHSTSNGPGNMFGCRLREAVFAVVHAAVGDVDRVADARAEQEA